MPTPPQSQSPSPTSSDPDPLWTELTRLAHAATAPDAQLSSHPPSLATITRWTQLFAYTPTQAAHLIATQRASLTRERLTDSHWNLIKHEKEAAGYDREAYEHALQLGTLFREQSASIPTTTMRGEGEEGEMVVLFRLGGLLGSAEKVREVAGLERLPKVVKGTGEIGEVEFCLVSGEVRGKLEEWLVVKGVLQR